MGITYLLYQTLRQKQFILTSKPSGSDYLFWNNALEQGMFIYIMNVRYISSFKWRFYL